MAVGPELGPLGDGDGLLLLLDPREQVEPHFVQLFGREREPGVVADGGRVAGRSLRQRRETWLDASDRQELVGEVRSGTAERRQHVARERFGDLAGDEGARSELSFSSFSGGGWKSERAPSLARSASI